MKNGIRRLQQFPQRLFYNIDHWYNLSRYMDSLKTPDIMAQRDYIYDRRAHYPDGLPANPFIQCGLEPLSIYSATVNEMLLQSNEEKIRVFPAIPDGWATAFKLRARRAFMVASERKADGSIPGIWIESLKGIECKVQNPWSCSKISVWEIGKKPLKLKYKTGKNHMIAFKTEENHQYNILPGGCHPKNQSQTTYSSRQNNEAKHFYEATIGKGKDF